MLNVYTDRGRAYVASINKRHKVADSFHASAPWLLLLADGNIRSFSSMAEAKDEAQKRWPRCQFRRG